MKALLAATDAGIDFILVGGMASIAQGVPYTTHDVDIVPSLDPANLDRLHTFLVAQNARLRGRPGPPLRPARHHLGPGQLCLDTDVGWLDVLGTIGGGESFEDLLPHTLRIDLLGRSVRMLDLENILRIKRGLAGAKDLAQIPLIEETLRRRR